MELSGVGAQDYDREADYLEIHLQTREPRAMLV